MNSYFYSLLGPDRAQHQLFSSLSCSKIVNLTTSLLIMCSLVSLTQAQVHNKQWDKRFGGTRSEFLAFSFQTTDGGYLLGGHSYSGKGGDKTQPGRGDMDYWIVKIDSIGNKLWDKTLGGSQEDRLYSALETSDGGFLLAGHIYSGKGGDITEESRGTTAYPTSDYWIVKVDSVGNKLWDRRFGGSDWDLLYSILKTDDGGYLLAGWSNSYSGGDLTDQPQGLTDYWVIKIDSIGNKLWDKRFGGYSDEILTSVIQTNDKCYLLAGYTSPGGGGHKTEESRGEMDFWIIKIDSIGNKLWDKTFGGNHYDYLESVIQTSDEGYLLAGTSTSDISGEKSQANIGEWDNWIIKTDSTGTKLWDKTFGGSYNDNLESVIQASDGGYLLAGWSSSDIGGDITENNKGFQYTSDFWIVRININGTKQWDKRFGGSRDEILTSGIQAKDGCYLLAGFSFSGIGADKTQESRGDIDYWIVKTTPNKVLPAALRINFQDKHTKTPTGWSKDYGLPFGEKTMADTSYIYGWKNRSEGTPVDLSVGGSFPGNGRHRPAPSAILLATFMHMQGEDVKDFRGTPVEAYWEVAVENGDYQVTVSVGDGMNYTNNDLESHSINIEGESAIANFIPQGSNGATTRFKQATVEVSVMDGLLTLDADGGTNTKINYAIIQPLNTSSIVTARKGQYEMPAMQSQGKVYPNPFSDIIKITTLQNGEVSVSIHDVWGKSYDFGTHHVETGELLLDVSATRLKAGMYLLKLKAEDARIQLIKILKK